MLRILPTHSFFPWANSLSDDMKVQQIPSYITVVAVTKTFPFEMVEKVYRDGLRHIGENRVEEAREKIIEAKKNGFDDIVWHMIGHVQSRKAKEVAVLFDWVDSVDSVAVARALDREAGFRNKKLHVLLEVNLAGEKTKYGFDLNNWEKDNEKLEHFLLSIHESMKLNHIVIEGLMAMAPYVTNPEENRLYFRSMKKLSETIRARVSRFGTQLSMGTSCDYAVAIEEGATQVRLGEALFGKRDT